MSNKTLLRIGCMGTALLLLMLSITINTTLRMNRYRLQLAAQQSHALQELSSQLNTITVDLKKSEYAGTPAQLSSISAKVWKSAGTAKASFGSLPAGDADLEEVYRFLSQVGDYAMYLSKKTVNGEALTQEERANVEQLSRYAQALNSRLAQLEYQISSGEVGMEELFSSSGLWAGQAPQPVSLQLDGMQEELESYPTLIYDGPFSDHLLQKSPSMTKGEVYVSPDAAKGIAEGYAVVAPGTLRRGSDENSQMPSYTFYSDEVEVGVTKQGGHVTYLLCGREIRHRQISVEDGRELGRRYLEALSIGSMRETYYELAGGVLTINYAYSQGDVLCYTDLIKVGVALDNGQVVFYDARGFINNHKTRELAGPLLSLEDAVAVLSPSLKPRTVQLALVPTAGLNEALCYELRCRSQSGEDVLVYINVETGAEEQILILIESRNGTLAM